MDQNFETGKTPFKDKFAHANELTGSPELVVPEPDKQSTNLSQQDSSGLPQDQLQVPANNLTFKHWLRSTILACVSYPVVSSLSLVSALASLLTFVDFSSALLSPGGLEELYWLIQFSWLGLLFPSSLAEAIGVPWNDGIFTQFISAFFRCGFVMLVGGAVLCWMEILRNDRLSQPKKIFWLITITLSTLTVCPFPVPLFLFLHWLPEKRAIILQRWKNNQSALSKEDYQRMTSQLAFIAILFAGLFGLGFAARFPVGRLFG